MTHTERGTGTGGTEGPAVALVDDPGRGAGTSPERRRSSPGEAEPATRPEEPGARVLIAGVGNIFLADDAFGPEVITELHGRALPDRVHMADFGIRGFDLAYRLLDGYDAAVLVDAAPRGGAPGTLYLVEPDTVELGPAAAPEAHGMDPVKVLALARSLSADGPGALPRIVVLGCEPEVRMRGDEAEVIVGLSEPVREAVGAAADLLETLVGALLSDPRGSLGVR